ncbi:MAG TPA: NIPSNAP family protein [Tepidisphaeraceae bacterium]|nr:NIPSNAP family protein [Tepidisphaeraceae bacterium]
MFKSALFPACVATLFVSALGLSVHAADSAPGAERVFELREYHANPGKLDALNARFRDHTNKLFAKHGITIIAFWTPTDGEKARNTLIYILAFPSREAATKSWKDFQDDPDWKVAKAESEKDGALVSHVDSTFMKPTDYSPIK